MKKQEWIWQDGKLIEKEKAVLHVLSHGIHYGTGAFEGIRCYKTPQGFAIFHLEEHVKRLFYSIKPFKAKVDFLEKEISAAIVETVKKNLSAFSSESDSIYIRPLAICKTDKLRISPQGAEMSFFIACWPWGKYLSNKPIKVNLSSYIRIHPRSTICDAKICGHYVNSVLSTIESHEKGFDESLLLDFKGNIAEGPGENFFMIKKGQISTPPLGNILAGITRQSIIEMAKKEFDLEIKEKEITLKEAQEADELFFTGTAAEITAIGQLEDQLINQGKEGPITQKLREKFFNIVTGKEKNYQQWLTYVN